jgi:tetratricopeptide (TPR) repeat protein
MHAFEITIQRRLGNSWPVVVEYSSPSTSLQQRAEGRLALDLDHMNAVTAEDYGQTLGKALFREQIAVALKRAQPADNELLHVLLFVEADDLKPLRWERLCVPVDDQNWSPIALQQLLPFSLYLPTTIDRQFPPFGRHDLKALIVVSNPSDLAKYNLMQFDAAGAIEGIRGALGESIPSSVLGPVAGASGPASLDVLCERITADPCTIVHVIAHGRYIAGMKEPLLYLSNPDNTTDPTKASDLVNRLSKLQKLPQLAFLCSCELAAPEAESALGGLAQRLVRELGMPAVIAMTDRVSVATATDLSSAFYPRLRQHGEVDSALSESYAGLANRPGVVVPVPVLFTRLGRRPLFSDTLDRELTRAEIARGLVRLRGLLPERSPILFKKFEEWAAVVDDTNVLDPKEHSAEVLRDRDRAVAAINEMCGEVVEVSFKACAIGSALPSYDARCPFAGLYPFTRENREFFFGREPLIEQLRRRLEDSPFLAVLGSSGSGKSSVVVAGLLPRLCPGPDCSGSVVMTPGDDPTARLDAALAAADTMPLVLVVDQFEELFTLCTSETRRKLFFSSLFKLLPKVKIVITMRADFLGECADYQQLRESMQTHQELIPPMNEEELRRAMESQAQVVKLRFEANLANQILDDVRQEPGAMPLLQHALRELWKRRHGRWLKADEYADKDKLGGVTLAISRSADALFAGATPAERERMRFIFERLARIDTDTPEPEKRRDTRRRESLDGLTPDGGDPEFTRQLVTKLADARLVVTSHAPDTGSVEVEVAHEALIRYWGRLRQWLDEARDTERVVTSIRDGAAVYTKRSGTSKFSLRGRDLAEAVKLKQAQPPRLSRSEVKFVNACRRYESVIKWSLVTTAVVFGMVALAAVWQWRNAEAAAQRERDAADEARRAIEDMTSPEALAFLETKVELQPEQRQFLELALTIYQRYTTLAANTEDELDRQGKAYARMGILWFRLGSLSRAEEAYKAAVTTYQQLSAEHPQMIPYRSALAESQLNLSNLLDGLNRSQEAIELKQAAAKECERLAGDEPGVPNHRWQLAGCHSSLGTALAHINENAKAELEFRTAIKTLEGLQAIDQNRSLLVHTRINLGILLRKLKKGPEAESEFRAALNDHTRVGPAQRRLGEYSDVLASIHDKLGSILSDVKKWPEAEGEYQSALKEQKRAIADRPGVPIYRAHLAEYHHRLGDALKYHGKLREAEIEYQGAIQERSGLLADYPDGWEHLHALAKGQQALGIVLRGVERWEDAAAAYREAIKDYRRLVSKDYARQECCEALGGCFYGLSQVRQKVKALPGAEDELRAAIKDLETLVKNEPAIAELRRSLGGCYMHFGLFSLNTGNHTEAETAYRAALDVFERLAVEKTDLPEDRKDMGVACLNLGLLYLHEIGQPDKALDWFTKAITHFGAGLQNGDSQVRSLLLNSYEARALAFHGLGRHMESATDYEHAAELDAGPTGATCRLKRTIELASSGDPDRAVAELKMLQPEAKPVFLVAAASLYATAASKTKDAVADAYAARAVAYLQEAIRKGYTDSAYIENNHRFDPIRKRNDFQKLMAELNAKANSKK